MQLLSDKVIFLTGGSMGIGLECAKSYVNEGAIVVIAAWPSGPVTEAVSLLGSSKNLGISCDVSNASQVADAIQQTLDKYGRIDAIHNNAGIASPSKPLHETSDEEWDNLMNVNLKSVLLTTRFGYEALRKSKGSILNTSSLVGDIGQENHAAYTATKGGMNALTKSMALDYAKDKIRVNAVMPAGVWTPMLRKWSQEQPNSSSIEKYLDDIHPLGYCPEGDAIADACVFLLSDKARFITGTTLAVSGGAELGYRRNY
ncbi:SDR family oxidoreductase [Pedobacter gandavensis]|uniref:SDR family NAD(P)-dependent oxidoreductase n=1 Tax=Pedobacter gandavensis TaxID=2679963 RepID=UPI00292D2CD3|nr:SDR family oxidoreductase [Pedobacter gandavensis]